MDVASIIDTKGGPTAVANAINVSPGAVRTWKCRNRIPRAAWAEVIDAFPDVTLDVLKAANAEPQAKAA